MINKKLKKNKEILYIITGTIVVLWLLLLTLFTAWAWEMHLGQAEVDGKTILDLRVENGKQQMEIDELRDRE